MKSDGKKLKPGEEVKLIDNWSYCYDELEELKKIFFEFLKRWVDSTAKDTQHVNHPVLYERCLDDKPFKL